MHYTAKSAQVATGLLTSCNNLLQQADIRMRSHGLRQLVTTSLLQVVNRLVASLVRSLSGTNWQVRDKADKVSISFPATPKDKLKCFWGCNEDIRKIYHPGERKVTF